MISLLDFACHLPVFLQVKGNLFPPLRGYINHIFITLFCYRVQKHSYKRGKKRHFVVVFCALEDEKSVVAGVLLLWCIA